MAAADRQQVLGGLAAQLVAAGVAAHQAGQVVAAEQYYRQAMAASPSAAHPYNLAGLAVLAQGRAADAVALLQTSVRLAPRVADYQMNLGAALRAAGDNAAAVAAYRRAIRLNPEFAEAYFNLGNTHREAGRLDEARQAYARALSVRADYADARNNLGHTLAGLGRHEEARAAFAAVLVLTPGRAEAQANLAGSLAALGRAAEALVLARAALAAGANDGKIWRLVVELCGAVGAPVEAAAQAWLAAAPGDADAQVAVGLALIPAQIAAAEGYFGAALAIDPRHAVAAEHAALCRLAFGDVAGARRVLADYVAVEPAPPPRILTALAKAASDAMELDAAEDLFRQALVAAPDFADARAGLGVILLTRGEYREGFALYESRFGAGLARRRFAIPLWDGGVISAGRLLISAEQGFGDVLQMARFVPRLLGTRVVGDGRLVLEVHRPLVRFLQRLHADIEILPFGDDPARGGDVVAELPICSLPHVLGVSLQDLPGQVPYLAASDAARARACAMLAHLPRPWIGLAWAGNAAYQYDYTRSAKLADMAPLIAAGVGSFVSLQKDLPAGDDVVAAGLFDAMAGCADFADTAGVLAALDCVVSVDTAVAHAAGALGVPVMLLNRFNTEWRWGAAGKGSVWYPRHTVFRQSVAGDWGDVVGRVMGVLRDGGGQSPPYADGGSPAIAVAFRVLKRSVTSLIAAATMAGSVPLATMATPAPLSRK